MEAEAKVGHEVQAAAVPAAVRLAHHHHTQRWQLGDVVQTLHELDTTTRPVKTASSGTGMDEKSYGTRYPHACTVKCLQLQELWKTAAIKRCYQSRLVSEVQRVLILAFVVVKDYTAELHRIDAYHSEVTPGIQPQRCACPGCWKRVRKGNIFLMQLASLSYELSLGIALLQH